jgi:hypothetical protein
VNRCHFQLIPENYVAVLLPTLPGLSSPTYLQFWYRVVVLDKVTDLLLFFGKLLVVGGVGKDQDQGLQGQRGRGVGQG